MYTSLLKITSFYKDFLSSYYQAHPDQSGQSFAGQYKHLMDQGYGYADYFPLYLEKNHGMEAAEIIHNAVPLQQAWAREHGSRLAGDDLLLEQIRQKRPEVLFIQDSANFSAAFVERVRKEVNSVRLMIGHVCAPYTRANVEAFGKFDLMLTCSEKFRDEMEHAGIRCHPFPHAFEASLLSEIRVPGTPENDIIFLGSFLGGSEGHRERIRYMEKILEQELPLRMLGMLEEDPWLKLKMKQASFLFVKVLQGAGIKRVLNHRTLRKIAQLKELPRRTRYPSLIRENLKRELLFGKRMLSEIASHAIGFNIHGEGAGDYAANVRMFEVAGAGSLLVTDHKKNIGELFEPDVEILTYRNRAECTEKLKWALEHPEEAREIAGAGQRRVLKEHSVEKRVDLLVEIMSKEFSKKG